MKQSSHNEQAILDGLKSAEENAAQGVENSKEYIAIFGRGVAEQCRRIKFGTT